MSKEDFTETEEKRIIEIYKGKDNGLEETLKSTAIKASDELEKEITPGSVYWVLKKKGIPRKKQGMSGKSHEGHFHGNGNSNQIRYSSFTEEMTADILNWFNEFGGNISAYKKVSGSFKEKYGKGLRYPVFQEILTLNEGECALGSVHERITHFIPSSFFRCSTLSVFSQVKSGSLLPKWP